MGLWQQMKSGKVTPEKAESRAGFSPEPQTSRKPGEAPGDASAGKKRIKDAIDRISDLWSEIESSGGSIAWEWILRGSHYGMRIQKAEDLIDKIGSRGDPAALASACNAWVSAWRDGIEAWKKKAASGM